MYSLRSLPRNQSIWEVGELPSPIADSGTLLLVVDITTPEVRLAHALVDGDSVEQALRDAFLRPSGGAKPGRPRLVRLSDASLLERVAAVFAAAGAEAVLVASLPAVDAVAAQLGGEARGAAPGVSADLGAWRQALDELIRIAPWTELDGRVLFTFSGGGLDGRVGVIIGFTRQMWGVALYDRIEDLEAFIASRGSDRMPDIRCWTVHLEPASELSPAEVLACEKSWLKFANDIYPRVYGFDGASIRAPDPEEHRRFLLAIEAINAVCGPKLRSIARGDEVSIRIRRSPGEVEVTARRMWLGVGS